MVKSLEKHVYLQIVISGKKIKQASVLEKPYVRTEGVAIRDVHGRVQEGAAARRGGRHYV